MINNRYKSGKKIILPHHLRGRSVSKTNMYFVLFIQFFQIIGDLFHRPIIKNELKPKLPRLLDFMHANLDAVKEIFDEEMAVSLPKRFTILKH